MGGARKENRIALEERPGANCVETKSCADERLHRKSRVSWGLGAASEQGWPRFLFCAVASTERRSIAAGFLRLCSSQALSPALSFSGVRCSRPRVSAMTVCGKPTRPRVSAMTVCHKPAQEEFVCIFSCSYQGSKDKHSLSFSAHSCVLQLVLTKGKVKEGSRSLSKARTDTARGYQFISTLQCTSLWSAKGSTAWCAMHLALLHLSLLPHETEGAHLAGNVRPRVSGECCAIRLILFGEHTTAHVAE